MKDVWLADDKISFFDETKTIHDLNFKVYKLPETEEHVTLLSAALIHTLDPSKILREVFTDTLIEEINTPDIKLLLQSFTLMNSKIALVGNDLLTN